MTRLHSPKALAALALAALTACTAPSTQPTVFHAYRALPTRGWARTDTVTFRVLLPDTAPPLRLTLGLRHRTAFPYRRLPIQLTLHTRGRLPVCDTLCLEIADSLGNWYGAGWGDLRTVASPSLRLPAALADTCLIRLRSLLPDTLLPGVNDIGLKLTVDKPQD